MIKVIFASFAVLILCIGAYLFFIYDTVDAPQNSNTQSTNNGQERKSSSNEPTSEFDKDKYSLAEPESIWVVINKRRPLPEGFVPSDLTVPNVALRLGNSEEQMQIRKVVVNDLTKLFDAAAKDNVTLIFGSGYRSEELQKTFYEQYVASSGKQAADTFSARPSHSEHQTGLSFDVTNKSEKCHLQTCFAETPEGKWVAKNAHKYGFVIRYPKGKDQITGYQFEPWHLRYVGQDLAEKINSSKESLEEFFDLEPAPTY